MNAEDFYRELLERRSDLANAPAEDASRRLLVVGDFLTSLEIDGLSYWLHGIATHATDPSEWAELVETAEALDAIGAIRTSRTLRSLIPRIREHRGYEDWQQLLKEQGVDLYEDDLEEVEHIWHLAGSLLGKAQQEIAS